MRSFFSGAVYFNSRPRKEVDIWTGFLKQLKIFQLTTSQGGWPVKRSPVNTRFIFQLTTSQGGRHLGHGFYMHCGREFQLTTSQGGRPATQPASGFDYDISTHDLARRSTMGFDREDDNLYHFNSRPRKEVDISFYPLYKKIKWFQLTTSQGGRPLLCYWFFIWNFISTHDLARRSTWGRI